MRRTSHPAAARAEWLAEFRDDVGGWAGEEIIDAAVDYGVPVRPPVRAGENSIVYSAGCDPSGGARDSFTAAIAHNEGGGAVLDCVVEVKAPFNPSAAVDEVAATFKAYGITSCTGDKYAAQWVVEAFAKVGITYTHSERDRSAIYLDALPLFTSGRARLLDNPRLVTQFKSLERRTSPIGKDRVDHGPGGFDDLCNSAALAMVLAAGEGDILREWIAAFGDETPSPPPAPSAPPPERIWDAVRGVYFYEEVPSA